MLTVEQIILSMKDRNLRKVAEVTGLAYDTVWRVANGKSVKPSYETISKLSDYLESRASEVKGE